MSLPGTRVRRHHPVCMIHRSRATRNPSVQGACRHCVQEPYRLLLCLVVEDGLVIARQPPQPMDVAEDDAIGVDAEALGHVDERRDAGDLRLHAQEPGVGSRQLRAQQLSGRLFQVAALPNTPSRSATSASGSRRAPEMAS